MGSGQAQLLPLKVQHDEAKSPAAGSQRAPIARLTRTENGSPTLFVPFSGSGARAPANNGRKDKTMNTSKRIDLCIELLKTMLGDANNELTSGQREALKNGIRNLKRLQKATKLTHQDVLVVVAQITEAAYGLVETGISA